LSGRGACPDRTHGKWIGTTIKSCPRPHVRIASKPVGGVGSPLLCGAGGIASRYGSRSGNSALSRLNHPAGVTGAESSTLPGLEESPEAEPVDWRRNQLSDNDAGSGRFTRRSSERSKGETVMSRALASSRFARRRVNNGSGWFRGARSATSTGSTCKGGIGTGSASPSPETSRAQS
jgi:hypothetical protein